MARKKSEWESNVTFDFGSFIQGLGHMARMEDADKIHQEQRVERWEKEFDEILGMHGVQYANIVDTDMLGGNEDAPGIKYSLEQLDSQFTTRYGDAYTTSEAKEHYDRLVKNAENKITQIQSFHSDYQGILAANDDWVDYVHDTYDEEFVIDERDTILDTTVGSTTFGQQIPNPGKGQNMKNIMYQKRAPGIYTEYVNAYKDDPTSPTTLDLQKEIMKKLVSVNDKKKSFMNTYRGLLNTGQFSDVATTLNQIESMTDRQINVLDNAKFRFGEEVISDDKFLQTIKSAHETDTWDDANNYINQEQNRINETILIENRDLDNMYRKWTYADQALDWRNGSLKRGKDRNGDHTYIVAVFDEQTMQTSYKEMTGEDIDLEYGGAAANLKDQIQRREEALFTDYNDYGDRFGSRVAPGQTHAPQAQQLWDEFLSGLSAPLTDDELRMYHESGYTLKEITKLLEDDPLFQLPDPDSAVFDAWRDKETVKLQDAKDAFDAISQRDKAWMKSRYDITDFDQWYKYYNNTGGQTGNLGLNDIRNPMPNINKKGQSLEYGQGLKGFTPPSSSTDFDTTVLNFRNMPTFDASRAFLGYTISKNVIAVDINGNLEDVEGITTAKWPGQGAGMFGASGNINKFKTEAVKYANNKFSLAKKIANAEEKGNTTQVDLLTEQLIDNENDFDRWLIQFKIDEEIN